MVLLICIKLGMKHNSKNLISRLVTKRIKVVWLHLTKLKFYNCLLSENLIIFISFCIINYILSESNLETECSKNECFHVS